MSVVVCTDLSGKEPPSQIVVDTLITSGSLDSVMVRKKCGHQNPVLGAIFQLFVTPMSVI